MRPNQSKRPLRITLIGPTYPFRGGIAHYTTLLAQALRQEGHQLQFLSFTRQYPRWLYGRDDKDPSQRPIKTEVNYTLDSVNPISWWHTLDQLRSWKPDLVIIPWWVPFWAPIWRYLSWGVHRSAEPKPQIIFICHNVLPHEASAFDKIALKVGIGQGDGFVVHAQSEHDRLRAILPTARIATSPLPTFAKIAADMNPDEQLLALPTDKSIVLFCGLIREYKGLDILIKAFAQLQAQKPDVHLAIVGEFWNDKDRYIELIDHLELAPYISVRGEYVSNETLAAYLDRANVVVLPYRHATQSAILQTAFGAKTPVITTAVGGLAEVVTHGKTGLLIPPEDPVALGNALLAYFNQNLETKFKQNLTDGTDRFEWRHLVSKIVSFLP